MGDVFTVEDAEFVGYLPDDEIVLGKVLTVKKVIKPFKDDDGNPVEKVEFKVQIIQPGGTHDGVSIWGDTSTYFNTHPNNKLRNWATSILGQELPAGYRLDTDVLENREVRVIVGYRTWDKADGTKGEKNYVKDFMPTREAMANFSTNALAEEPF